VIVATYLHPRHAGAEQNRRAMMNVKTTLATMIFALAALQPMAAMCDQTANTRSKLKNDGISQSATPVCNMGQNCPDTLEFSWGASNMQSLHLDSADFAPAKGDAFSVCGSAACDSGKATFSDLSFTAKSSGAGTVVLRSSASVVTTDDTRKTGCVQGKHWSKVQIKRGSSTVTLSDVMVSSCSSGSVTLSYQDMAINEKGHDNRPTTKK
jgi:hypothetical protein